MLNAIIGALVGAGVGRVFSTQESAKAARKPIGPYALDAELPPHLERSVWNCWAKGTEKQCADFGKALRAQFPIASATLLARAYVHVTTERKKAAVLPEKKTEAKPKLSAEELARREDARIEKAIAEANGSSFARPLDDVALDEEARIEP